MAFVAISGNLLERVKDKISGMHRAELKTLGERPETTLDPSNPLVKKILWGEYAHLHDLMPIDWTNSHNSMEIRFDVPGYEGQTFDTKIKATQGEFRFTPKSSWYQTHQVDAAVPELALVVEYAKQYTEITQRWEGVKDKVFTFLNACKSANEAVKLWPQVAMYLHPEDIARIEKKVVRSGSSESNGAQALAGIDTASVESAAVIARLSGAQL